MWINRVSVITFPTAALTGGARLVTLNDVCANLHALIADVTYSGLNQRADFVFRLVTKATAALTTGDGENFSALLANDLLKTFGRTARRSQRNQSIRFAFQTQAEKLIL
jgi:hypothetical protein